MERWGGGGVDMLCLDMVLTTSGSWKGPVWTWTFVHGTHYLWLLVECCLDMVLTTSGSWKGPL